jgi:hypothetical protein
VQETSVINKGRYYVYGLFKPCGTPFYIGKGSGTRVNDHFKPSNLKVNTPKTGIIKKYGNSVIRSILCYFDSEESAYEYEEWLISHYGLKSEGGLLANYAKSRFEYSDKFAHDICSKSKKHTDEHVAISMMLLEAGLAVDHVALETGFSCSYLRRVAAGDRRSYGAMVNPNPPICKRKRQPKLTQAALLDIIYQVSQGTKNWKEIVSDYKTSRKSINHASRFYNINLPDSTGKIDLEFDRKILYALENGMRLCEICNFVGKSKSTVFNAAKRVAKGSLNGTSDNVASQDNSANNLSNK